MVFFLYVDRYNYLSTSILTEIVEKMPVLLKIRKPGLYDARRSIKKDYILYFLLVFLFFPCVIKAQEGIERQTAEQFQFWTSLNSTIRLSQHFGLIGDVHIRRENFVKDPNFYFLRLGGVYWVNNQFSFVGGTAALWNATETNIGTKYALERRIYQQVLWRAVIGQLTFLQRIRTEQRWHQVLNSMDGSVDRVRFSNRFRFLMSASMQVFNKPALPRPTISNEILFHMGKEIVYNTFDQNRLFLGFNQQIGKNLRVDYGYMMVYQQQYTGREYNLNHTFRLFFYYSPDFRKESDENLPHYPIGGIE